MAQCEVCCENLNQSTRKAVSCFCEFVACRECCERVLLDSITDPHCMSCRKEWNREFLVNQFTQKFVNNDLKKHREKILFDRERSMLPATQVYVERKKRQAEILEETQLIEKQIEELRLKKNALLNGYYRLQTGLPELPEPNDIVSALRRPVAERREFVRACTVDGCKGFLSTQWKCGVCDTWTCPECHETKGKDKDAPHTCKPDNVATAKLLSKDSQPCPKCASMCTKVDGCDQVFAMCCGTTFNWRTGKIDSGPIHAPDYYRWLQRNGKTIPRNPLDIPCGGLPHIITIRNHLASFNLDKDLSNKIQRIHRAIQHIQNVELYTYIVRDRGEQDNRDLRIQYMMNDLPEDQFMVVLQQREKARNKKKEIHGMLSTVSLAGTDIYQRISVSTTAESVDDLMKELENLRSYNNEAMGKISKTYKCVTPRITEDWVLFRCKETFQEVGLENQPPFMAR